MTQRTLDSVQVAAGLGIVAHLAAVIVSACVHYDWGVRLGAVGIFVLLFVQCWAIRTPPDHEPENPDEA